MQNPCTTHAQARVNAKLIVSACLTLMVLTACSPGGVVAGTVGAAGVVAGAAVDVVLRSEVQPGEIE